MNDSLYEQAKALGASAFAAGKMSVPARDSNVMTMLAGKQHKDVIAILDGWSTGWHTANLAAPV